jgi:hypothetical protein
MPTDPARSRGRRHGAGLLAIVVGVFMLAVVVGCRTRAPQVEFANRRYSAAVRTAANTKSLARLARAKELIDRDHAGGVISPEEYAAYRAIIDLAEAGRWEAAERAALNFRRDQQR